MCTLVNALVNQEKRPPAQVAAGDDSHDCKWSIFASWWKEKHHQRKLHSVKTILGTSIGAGCSNQIQVAQGQDLHYGVSIYTVQVVKYTTNLNKKVNYN